MTLPLQEPQALSKAEVGSSKDHVREARPAVLPWPTMLRCSRSLVRSRMSAFRLGSKGLSSAMKGESRRPGFKTLRRGTQVPLLMGISSPPVAILQTLRVCQLFGRSGGSCRSLEVPAGAPTIFKNL